MTEAFASSFSSVYTKEALEHPASHQTYNGTTGTGHFLAEQSPEVPPASGY